MGQMGDQRQIGTTEENMATEEKTAMKKKHSLSFRWIFFGVCAACVCALLYTAFYGSFRKGVENLRTSPVETENGVTFLYQYSYLLYRDMYNKVNNTNLSYSELFMQPAEGKEWIHDETSQEYQELYAENTGEYDALVSCSNYLDDHFSQLESGFAQMNLYYDYLAEDLSTGEILTNLSSPEISLADQYFYLSFEFDESGNVSIGSTVKGNNATIIRKYANEVMRNLSLENLTKDFGVEGQTSSLYTISMPTNFRITFCIAQNDWQQMWEEDYINLPGGGYVYDGYSLYEAYRYSGSANLYLIFLGLLFLAALFLPVSKKESFGSLKLYRIPAEAVLVLMVMLISLSDVTVVELVMNVADGSYQKGFEAYMPAVAARLLVLTLNLLALGLLFFGAWYGGTCFRLVRELGIKRYIKERSVIYRIFLFLKTRFLEVYGALNHFDVTKSAKKLIWKVVLINGVILLIISSFWVSGLFIVVIYSVVLYFILKKYISGIQKKYSILLGYINRIAEGNLNGNMTEDLGVFEPLKPQLIRIQRGFRKAVEEEVKSQKMKSELITNVSHDLKTPLTAIITYINLLKDENLTQEQRREYLDTLERKSNRLKVLIEDLFEVSKASTGNITLNFVKVDIMNLVKQVLFEWSDKLEEAGLDLRLNLTDEKVVLSLDSQKTYRIYENLVGNIVKYAMPGTRVYINGFRIDDTVVITLKNISAQEIHVEAKQLTERFIRGDASRNTEGSGLGLAIARSFTELQNGRLELEVDGDLFKVTTTWKIDTKQPQD